MNYPQEKVLPKGYEGDSKHEQVEAMFDNIAPAYDCLNHIMSMGIDKYWRLKAINHLKPYPTQRMLDVATGTGDFAILAARKLHPEQLIGVDISEGMMKVGQKKVLQAGLAEIIRFQQEDCTCLSFEDNSFNAITVAFGIRNFEDLDKGLKEMHRVLCEDGKLVILELSEPIHFPMKQLYHFYSKRIIPFIGRLISKDNSAYTYLPESIKAFPQGEIMQQIIYKAGFREVTFKRLTFGVCTLYIAKK